MTGSNETPGRHHAGEMGRDGIRSNCLALSTIGAGRMRAWMSGEQRQALEWGFRSAGLGQPSDGAAALFVAADTWSRIAGAADIAGGLPSPASVARDLGSDALELLPALRRLPRRLDQIGHLAERGELTLRVRLFADDRDVKHVERLTDRLILAFFSASVGLVSVLLLALPAKTIAIHGTDVGQVIGYAGLTAATLLGLRVVAAIGRHRK